MRGKGRWERGGGLCEGDGRGRGKVMEGEGRVMREREVSDVTGRVATMSNNIYC